MKYRNRTRKGMNRLIPGLTGLVCSAAIVASGCANTEKNSGADTSEPAKDAGNDTSHHGHISLDAGDGVAGDGVDDDLFDIEIGASEIPYIVIDTKGNVILNEPKIPGEMTIYSQKSLVQSAHIGIEYRGSTSFRMSDKKSFGIETWDAEGNDMDVAFFDFPEEEDWILTGHLVGLTGEMVGVDVGYVVDRTLMYHHVGYQLFRSMGRYASRTKFVELELNGEYLGVYIFMEKLKRDKNRINIEKLNPEDSDPDTITGGYILKIDKTAGGEVAHEHPLEYFESNWQDDSNYTPDNSFRSPYDINGDLLEIEPFRPTMHPDLYLETYFLYESPKAEKITDPQKNYIQGYLNDFETALLSDDFTTDIRTYTNYIDLDSFVDYFIINEVCRNVDGYRLSTYLYKDRGGKLKMGPPWDLNIGFDRTAFEFITEIPFDEWVINYNQYTEEDFWMMPFWWPRLMADPIFRDALKFRWTELRSTVMSTETLLALVDQTATYLQDNGAINRNYSLWDADLNIDYDESIESLKSFLEERTLWMDEEISSM